MHLHVSSIILLILRRSQEFFPKLCTGRSFTESADTRCYINTIWPPADEQDIVRNMQRIVFNVLKNCSSSWSLYKVANVCRLNINYKKNKFVLSGREKNNSFIDM
jgi:hypothetical protein